MDRTIQLAWAAGFTDGEGYIGLTRCFDKVRGRYSYRVQFEVAQVHEAPIRLMASMFDNVGRVRHYKNHKRGYWTWRVFGQAAIEVVKILMPYLVVKSAQAQLVMEYEFTDRRNTGDGRWRKTPDDIYKTRMAIWAACCELNGGRAVQVERLSEEAPTDKTEGDAIVRSHEKSNHESQVETPDRLRLVR